MELTFVCGYIIISLYPQEGGDFVGIKKGTKLTDSPKSHTLKFRYDDDMAMKLDYLSQLGNMTRSEIVRKGIEIQFEKEK